MNQVLGLAAAALAMLPTALANECKPDNCANAVTGTHRGDAFVTQARSGCSSFMNKTATATPVTITSTIAPPWYASACSGTARYSSACSCWGIHGDTATASPTATVLPTINNAIATTRKILLKKRGVNLFWREQSPDNPCKTIVLLHGFPASSHQYRNLIPQLAKKYRVVAPDLPGFGFTETPENFKYSFDTLTDVIEEFLDALSIKSYSVYIFDYGAPVGLRLALRRPQSIEAIISQNGNAYSEGFGDVWGPLETFWASNDTTEDRNTIADAMLTFNITKFQYVHGTPDENTIAPETYTLDYALLQATGRRHAQVDLFFDYQYNIPLYAKFQEYFRSSQVPLLAVWGKNDPFFIPQGAEAFKRDLPNAVVQFIDAGHFAVESNTTLIGNEIIKFLN